MFSLNYKVTTSNCNRGGGLKLYSALQMMQDCSEMWIDSEPEVKAYFRDHHMAQLLASRQVEILRVPHYKEDLTVTTSVFGMESVFGFRNTVILDGKGKPCYLTWSTGAFVDKVSGKLAKVPEEIIAAMRLEDKVRMEYKNRRIILPKIVPEIHAGIKVMRNDIDYNQHTNNANYVRMALELLPENFVVRSMRVEYKIPAKLGDVLVPEVINAGNVIYVVLKLDERDSTIMEFCR